jgi:hypothetical protein
LIYELGGTEKYYRRNREENNKMEC